MKGSWSGSSADEPRYPDVRTVFVGHLQSAISRVDADSAKLMEKIEEKIDHCDRPLVDTFEGGWTLSSSSGREVQFRPSDLNILLWLEIQTLHDLVLKDLRSKLAAENVVVEPFVGFASG